MGKKEKAAKDWEQKVKQERKRLRAYAEQYASEGFMYNVLVLEKDIERCVRALANAKRQQELSTIRESQTVMFEG